MKCIRKLPITVRTLETLIRLGTAHAKLRLSDTVTIEDIQVVFKILNFCIFSEDDETVKEGDQDLSLDYEDPLSPSPFKFIIGKSQHQINESDNSIITNIEKEPILVVLKNRILKKSNRIKFRVVKI